MVQVIAYYTNYLLLFQTILGDRYGQRHCPSELTLAEFDLLSQESSEQKHPHSSLLQDWYLKDDNAVPPCYVLQVRHL